MGEGIYQCPRPLNLSQPRGHQIHGGAKAQFDLLDQRGPYPCHLRFAAAVWRSRFFAAAE